MNSLTQYEFNSLDRETKVGFVLCDAVFLICRLEEDYEINLYIIYGFYVEVWIKKYVNEIDRILTFTQIDQLEPFLKEINIGTF